MVTLMEKWYEINKKLSEIHSSFGLTQSDINKFNEAYESLLQRKLKEDKAKMYLGREYHYMVKDIENLDSFTRWVQAGMHPKEYWIIEKYNFPVDLAIMLKR